MKLKLLLGLAIVFCLGIGAYLFLNQGHEDYSEKPSEIHVDALVLFQEFEKDEIEANKVYANKVLQVDGIVIEVGDGPNSYFVLGTDDSFFGVNVFLDSTQTAPNIGVHDFISVKGRCTGGDEMGVVITNAIIIKHEL